MTGNGPLAERLPALVRPRHAYAKSVAGQTTAQAADIYVVPPATIREQAMDEAFVATPLIHKLGSQIVLSDDERNALQSITGTIKTLDAHQDIVREGDRPSACCLILEGFAYRYKLTETGKRQILSFHIPGEIPDLQSLHLDVMDHSLGTLARSKLAFLSHETVRDLTRRCPRIADAFWRETLIDAA